MKKTAMYLILQQMDQSNAEIGLIPFMIDQWTYGVKILGSTNWIR
jgi:hypothetical protein